MNLNKILNFIKKNYKLIFIAAFLIVIALLMNQCSSTKRLKNELKIEKQRGVQNMAALNDSVQIYKNKLGELTYSKPVAQMSIKELEKYFPELYKKLEAELGEVKYITNTEIEYINIGTVHNQVSELENDFYSLNTEYYSDDSTTYLKSSSTFYAKTLFLNPDSTKFDLKITPGITTYEEIRFKFGLTTGIKKDIDGIYRIFVVPDNNNFTVTSLEGADVSNFFQQANVQNYKRWSVGIYAGVGVNYNMWTADAPGAPLSSPLGIGPSIGIGIQYILFRF